MLIFYKNEVDPGLKENLPLSTNIYEDTECVEEMEKMIVLLGNLSMFYAYNTNWGCKNLPESTSLELHKFSTTKKQYEPLKSSATERYVFHLSMPYTQEVYSKCSFKQRQFHFCKYAYIVNMTINGF